MNLRTWMKTSCAAVLLPLLAGSTAAGQQWATEMFDHTSYDFKTVARGAKAEHTFTMENIYEEDAQIASIASTCKCISAKYPKGTLKTWDKAQIVVEVDTRGFVGKKEATLKVKLNKPFSAEVRLHVYAYIRRDVVVHPGVVKFGTVYQGTSRLQQVKIDYAGRPDWKILRVESANPHLQAQAVETSRGDGQVTYDLLVTLRGGAAVGYLQDHVVLVTDDRNARASRVPVAVEGVVVPAVTARPSPLSGVVVTAGESVTERLIVQGKAPFRVLAATCSDQRFRCTVLERTDTFYTVNVTFTAGPSPGRVSSTIRIETDLSGTVLEVPVHIRVVPPSAATF